MLTGNNGYIESIEIQDVSKEKAFGQLQAQLEIFMQQARPGLLRQATQFGIAAEQAEDVVQETLLQAWRHLAELRAPELFHAWLYGICRNILGSVIEGWGKKHGTIPTHTTILNHIKNYLESQPCSTIQPPRN